MFTYLSIYRYRMLIILCDGCSFDALWRIRQHMLESRQLAATITFHNPALHTAVVSFVSSHIFPSCGCYCITTYSDTSSYNGDATQTTHAGNKYIMHAGSHYITLAKAETSRRSAAPCTVVVPKLESTNIVFCAVYPVVSIPLRVQVMFLGGWFLNTRLQIAPLYGIPLPPMFTFAHLVFFFGFSTNGTRPKGANGHHINDG